MACPRSPAARTTRSPRPPPPPAALTSTGYPIRPASVLAPAVPAGSANPPGRTGRPAATACARAASLSPAASSTSAPGPTKMIPAASQARASRDRRADDRLHAEVGFRQALPTTGRPDPDRPVGQPGRHGVRVALGDREHGLDAEPLAGTDDPDSDLAAVGDQHPPDDEH